MTTADPPDLSDDQLVELVRRVFRPQAHERQIAILCDLPDARLADEPAWQDRRMLAASWATRMARLVGRLGLVTHCFFYRHVGSNNADLPETGWRHRGWPLPDSADDLRPNAAEPLAAIFDRYPIMLAPTRFSATAPLKVAARRHRFRAATMPGFTRAMIPALGLDFDQIGRRVRALQRRLDVAETAVLRFAVGGERHELTLDLRYRTAHASTGLLTEPGTAGNLPSGEAYIVPYEGERSGDPSRSEGTLPVEIDGEVVLHRIRENRVREVLSNGEASRRQAETLQREPAAGNVAELGLGVLGDLGIRPIGEMLLDEKLGPHVAFGRSDHFGGAIGPADFREPEAVVHLDHVYLPECQPQVDVIALDLHAPGRESIAVVRDNRYVVDFGEGRDGEEA